MNTMLLPKDIDSKLAILYKNGLTYIGFFIDQDIYFPRKLNLGKTLETVMCKYCAYGNAFTRLENSIHINYLRELRELIHYLLKDLIFKCSYKQENISFRDIDTHSKYSQGYLCSLKKNNGSYITFLSRENFDYLVSKEGRFRPPSVSAKIFNLNNLFEDEDIYLILFGTKNYNRSRTIHDLRKMLTELNKSISGEYLSHYFLYRYIIRYKDRRVSLIRPRFEIIEYLKSERGLNPKLDYIYRILVIYYRKIKRLTFNTNKRLIDLYFLKHEDQEEERYCNLVYKSINATKCLFKQLKDIPLEDKLILPNKEQSLLPEIYSSNNYVFVTKINLRNIGIFRVIGSTYKSSSSILVLYRDKDTLYNCNIGNTYDTGDVCWGSIDIEKVSDRYDLYTILKRFLQTTFSFDLLDKILYKTDSKGNSIYINRDLYKVPFTPDQINYTDLRIIEDKNAVGLQMDTESREIKIIYR